MNRYSNRQAKTTEDGRKLEFFFPKANPPQTIVARSKKEAEAKLAANSNKEHE